MHLANEVPPQGSAGGNNIPDYALTADLLAERTLDGLFAEHPGELVRTGKESQFSVSYRVGRNPIILLATLLTSFSKQSFIFCDS